MVAWIEPMGFKLVAIFRLSLAMLTPILNFTACHIFSAQLGSSSRVTNKSRVAVFCEAPMPADLAPRRTTAVIGDSANCCLAEAVPRSPLTAGFDSLDIAQP